MTHENINYQAKKESDYNKQFTPEYTISYEPNVDDKFTRFAQQPTTKRAETEIPCEDPDVTQLEIDINSASLTSSTAFSQNNNSKKRQLINITENLKDYSILSDVVVHSSQENI